MDLQKLMAKTIEAVRNDGFTVSDNYLKGEDYPFGGGRLVYCEGITFGSLRFQGGGVILEASFGYYITELHEIPIFADKVRIAWKFWQEDDVEGSSEVDWEYEERYFIAVCCGKEVPESEDCGHGYCDEHGMDCPECSAEEDSEES